MYKGYYVSYFLGKIQSIRDIDAKQLFPPQLTSTEKKKARQQKASTTPIQKRVEEGVGGQPVLQPALLEQRYEYVLDEESGR